MNATKNIKQKKKLKIIELLIIFFIISTLIYLIYIVNHNVYQYFILKKQDLLDNIKKVTGFEIQYKKISPQIIGKIKVSEVLLSDQAGFRLELGDIELSYSLFSLIFNQKNTLTCISKINLKTLYLNIKNENELTKLKEIFSQLSQQKQDQPLIIKNIVLEIPKGTITITNKHLEYMIKIDNFKTYFNENIRIYSIINLAIKNNTNPLMTSLIKINGLIQPDPFLSKFKVDFNKLMILDNNFKTQRFNIENHGKNFLIQRTPDSLPIKIEFKKENDLLSAQMVLDNLNSKELFIGNKKSFYIPDRIKLDINLTSNFTSQNHNGHFILSSHYDNLVFLKNFNTEINIAVVQSKLIFNQFLIYNGDIKNNITLKGDYPLYSADYNLELALNDFTLPFTRINSLIQINHTNQITNINSDHFYLNAIDLGQLKYQIVKANTSYFIKSLIDFNGYSMNGQITNENEKVKYYISHQFNNFSISKIIKAYQNNYKDDFFLNGNLLTLNQDENLIIPNSPFTIQNKDKELANLNIYMNNHIISINKMKINTERTPINLIWWLNLNKKPVISYLYFKKDATVIETTMVKDKNLLKFFVNNSLYSFINLNENIIYFKANRFKIPINNYPAEINLNFACNMINGTIYPTIIYINNLRVFQNKIGSLRLKMSLYQGKLELNDILYQDNENKITGNSVQSLTIADHYVMSGQAFLKDIQKEESYSFDYNISREGINSKIYITKMDINKIIQAKDLNGNLDVRLNITNTVKKPFFDLEANINKATFGKNNLTAYLICKKNEKGINLKKAGFQLGNNRITLNDLSVIENSDNTKTISGKGTFFSEGLQKILKTNLSFQGDYTSLTDPKSPFNLNIYCDNLSLAYLNDNQFRNIEKYPQLEFNLKRENQIYSVKSTGNNYFYFEKNADTYKFQCFNNQVPVLYLQMNTSHNQLKGNAKFTKFPINVVQKLIKPYVGIDGGYIDGNLDIIGLLQHPQFYGTLNLYSGIVTLPDYLQESIVNISGVISADNNKFLVNNVNAAVRNGLGHGYGEIIFNGWKFESYSFHINSDNVPAKITQGPVDAKGIGRIRDFILEGSRQSYNFIGDFIIDTADVNLSSLMGINQKNKISKIPIYVLIKFEAGKRIKVNYPIIEGTITPKDIFILKFIGDEAKVYLGGNVSLNKGEVNYLNKKFKIEQANFQFYDNEDTINPNVNLKAYYRTKDFKREPVKIYININNRLIPLQTTFSSIPYKSQEEIDGLLGLSYAMNAQNSTDKTLEKSLEGDTSMTSLDTIVNTTNYISNSFIFNPLENRIRKATGLDAFTLNTKLFGNIIRSTSENYTNSLDFLDNTSITIGKYIFDELYFESVMTFNKKNPNMPQFFIPFSDQNYGLNLKLMLQIELPYLSIGYTYNPKDIKNFLDADHQISLEANFRL